MFRLRLVARLSLAGLLAFLLLFQLALPPAQAAVSVTDDSGRSVTLPVAARRIVSLSPHTTEMLFAAGAGREVLGVVEYSDYPPEASRIPSVGSGVALDLERIVALNPDLVVAWQSGNSAVQIERLRKFGIPVFLSEPRNYATIADSIERLGVLTGNARTGRAVADDFRARLARLQARYRDRRPLNVFYQVWRAPLMTLNGEHMVSHALRLCGARNIFEDLPILAPTVSMEAVVKADPDVIIASAGEQDDILAAWRRFPGMKAVASGNLRVIDGSLMNRSGPRILDGTEALCRELDAARRQR